MVKCIALLKRKPGLTREEFRPAVDLRTHEAIVASSRAAAVTGSMSPYRTSPKVIGLEPLYDGTAELWWDSVEAMEASFASDIGVAAGADADEFCEVRIHIYTEEHFVVPGP